MAPLDLGLRAFLLKCIEPKGAFRASSRMLLGDQWLTKHRFQEVAVWQEDILSEKEQHLVASIIKDGLKTKSSSEAILKYLEKRPFNTTGGMFNLLSIELLQSKRFGGDASQDLQDMKRMVQPEQSQPAILKQEKSSRKPLGIKAWRAWKRDKAENGNQHRLRRASSSAIHHDAEKKTGGLSEITNMNQRKGSIKSDIAETSNALPKPAVAQPAMAQPTSKSNRLEEVNDHEKKSEKPTPRRQLRMR